MLTTHITIAIITYQRPNSLQLTLEAIAALVMPENSKLSVLVVDNDVAQSAALVVQGLAGFPFPLRYVNQPQKGRGFARNTALDETLDEDYLAFIDDDITVAPDWLVEMLECCIQNQAQFCTGNLRYLYPDDAPRWVGDCGLFQSKANGKTATSASTGNLLIDRQWIAVQGLRFPLGIAGEDMFFTSEAYRRGALIMTCKAAHATTRIENDRINVLWVLRRAMRNGANRSVLYKRLDGPGSMIVASCRHAAQMAFYATGAAILACMLRRPWILVVEHGGMALGYIAGIFSVRSVIRFNS